MDFYNVNANSTRKADIFIDGANYYGPIFTGFENLNIVISPSLKGELDLGTRKLFYDQTGDWRFDSGSYNIIGSQKDWKYEINGNVQLTITGGNTADGYWFRNADPTTPPRVKINDFNYKQDKIYVREGFGYRADTEGVAALEKNLSFTHAGSGSSAQTRLIINAFDNGSHAEIFLPGHLGLDGVEAIEGPSSRRDSDFTIFLTPTSSLNIGSFDSLPSSPPVDAGSSSIVGVTTLSIAAEKKAVDEGSLAKFTLFLVNAVAGSRIEYQVTGVSVSDLAEGQLTGYSVIDSNGQALISIPVRADTTTEGTETLTVTAGGKTASMQISDTSLGTVAAAS